MIGFGIAFPWAELAKEYALVERNRMKQVWQSMRQRCSNPKNPGYVDYGGRGIECRFASVDSLIEALGPRPSQKHSIDRIDVNGHYEVGNVRWATDSQQNRNTRATSFVFIEGKRYKRADLEDQYGIPARTIVYRANKGWPFWKVVSKEAQWDTSSLPLAIAKRAEQLRGKPIPHINNAGRLHSYCRKGTHPLTEGNIYRSRSSRKCRQCVIDRREAARKAG